jgi:8-oxo-dGDP phosphatase
MDVEGEDPAETGRRELIEEVGYGARSMTALVSFENSAGWADERTHVFLAQDLTPERDPDFTPEAEEADMEVVRVPLADAVAMARRGELTDAKTVIGLLLAADRIGS